MTDRPILSIGLRGDRKIVITDHAGQFHVRVIPAPDGDDLGGVFVTHRAARGHASGLRLVHRWPIVDRTVSEGLDRHAG